MIPDDCKSDKLLFSWCIVMNLVIGLGEKFRAVDNFFSLRVLKNGKVGEI